MDNAEIPDGEFELSPREREFLKEVVRSIRGIRYGTVVLTIHDGLLVEISKTERIRPNPGS